jgi:hypothetical protein
MKWLKYLFRVNQDDRLNVYHLAIILAIVQAAIEQKSSRVVRISRSKLLNSSLIRTFPTYHKYLHDLQDLGYIKYIPSYHPGIRSTVEIII